MLDITRKATGSLFKMYFSKKLISNHVDSNYYRVIKIPDERDNKIHFQIIGKSIVLRMKPEEIMRDNLLMGFSKADVASITHLGTKNECVIESKKKTKLFRIIKQIFSFGKTLFYIEKEDGEVLQGNASQLCENNAIIEQINGVDGVKIGYSAAQEYYFELEKLKKSSLG